jgi:putative Holliday junction resolvase
MSTTPLKTANIRHFLGIDFGQSKIGLAVADSETRIAFAHSTLENDRDFLQKLAEIIENKNVLKIIIGTQAIRGLTSNMLEVRPRIKSDSEKLGNFLKEKLKVEVEYQEEMFTTKQAQKNLIEKGVKGVKKYDDQEAARIILQGWLDKNG